MNSRAPQRLLCSFTRLITSPHFNIVRFDGRSFARQLVSLLLIYGIRIMPGDPTSQYINSRGPYLRYFKNTYFDDLGNPTTKKTSESHIPLKGNPGL